MNLKKRASDVTVEKIQNGFLVSFSGRNVNEDWVNDKVYFKLFEEAHKEISKYFELPLD